MSRHNNGMVNPTAILTVRDRAKGDHTVRVEYACLPELRRNMKSLLQRAVDGEVHVARSRRGQWGEWFEVWDSFGGKPRLVREGWQ